MRSLYTLDFVLALVALYILTKLVTKRAHDLSPPGPKGYPIIGNLLDMPTEREWLTFAKWGERWGGIVSASVFGQQIIILNSAKEAMEMLDKNSAIYSDRPSIPMANFIGWDQTLALLPYGTRLRNYRKLFHQTIGTSSAMEKFTATEESETRNFLQRVSQTPDELAGHVRKTAGTIILRISHGYQVQETDDPLVALADVATEQFSAATAPGGFLVNLIPPLNNVPDWAPGTGFKQIARSWASTLSDLVERPHNFVKQQMALGTAEPSFTSRLLEETPDLTTEAEFDIKWSAASLYSSGSDTTVAAIYAFFKAMVLFPEVQEKAQAEIDAIIGNNRLPTCADRERLPYIHALALEVLRWHSVVPTGVPHRAIEDNFHNGYLIKKGALIMPNIWQMTHDPTTYKQPMSFNPERFLPSPGHEPEPDPRGICYGFGRRICPGRVLADTSVFVSCAMTLAVFTISKQTKNGIPLEPVVEQTSGTISHPIPFKCTITPRSPRALALLDGE